MKGQVIDAFIENTDDIVLLNLINLTMKAKDGRLLFQNPLEEPVLYTYLEKWVEDGIRAYKAVGGNL